MLSIFMKYLENLVGLVSFNDLGYSIDDSLQKQNIFLSMTTVTEEDLMATSRLFLNFYCVWFSNIVFVSRYF